MGKQTLRERVWDDLEASGVARFPFPPHGRIPNFEGADEAAERLAETATWRDAETVKANPDAPQLPVRRRALDEGKTVFMAVPRLRRERCFLELNPDDLEDPDDAATVSGMDDAGRPVALEDLPVVHLVVVGSVAVTESGTRLGKGEGYSDLEWAILAGFERVGPSTMVATTVHERQVVDEVPAPSSHDVPLDLIVTPERTIHTGTAHDRPAGLDWSKLDDERMAEIPVLRRLSRQR